jgi:oxygen-independent coproporphyrinogen-3 oxidase
MVAKEERKQKYINHLVEELKMKKEYYSGLKTIYIGGGTPSSLPLNLLDFLLTNIKMLIDIGKIEEFTIEANPNDITPEFVKNIKSGWINRISLGVQSFDAEKLRILNRKHNEEDVRKAMEILRSAAFNNVNIDLIYGIKGDDFKKVKSDLKKSIAYGANHISTYSLILEDKTILKKLADEDKFERMDEDQEAELYQKILAYLKKKGFIHYEISNFSRKNYQSKHNLTYWNNMNYIGVGAGSSYYINNIRYTNVNNLDRYCEGIVLKEPVYREKVELSLKDRMSEEMILGLRKIEGVNLKTFKTKFGHDAFEVFPIIKNLINLKLLKAEKDYLFIPEKSLYLSNEVLINFI